MIKTLFVEYHDGDTLLEGYCAYNETIKEEKPAVLVSHDWSGRNDFACNKAYQLAELGYVGFALDMYGKGKIGQSKEEKMALMQPFMQHRPVLQQRILCALATLKKMQMVDAKRISAIGFCFGGLCVLDLARSSADIKSVVSLHGLLQPPENTLPEIIKAKILALHGYDDPMVTPDQVILFANEMTAAKVDWQIHLYGNTMHAFTNPEAHDPDFGTVYNKVADQRAWVAMTDFLKETL